jgi:hypothetical protein
MVGVQKKFSRRLGIKLQYMTLGIKEYDITEMSKEEFRLWFRNYLLVMHSIIRSSVPLMKAALKRCKETDGKLLYELGIYYKKHMVEEMHHDEWVLNDLESIGLTRQESLSKRPLQLVAELVGSQYYWIYYWHPVSLLGYISFLEGCPPQKDQIDKLMEITGYPESAFRTISKHSYLDPNHRDDLNTLIDDLPLTTDHERWITSNALYSASKFSEISGIILPQR